jgi:hypothetical protein
MGATVVIKEIKDFVYINSKEAKVGNNILTIDVIDVRNGSITLTLQDNTELTLSGGCFQARDVVPFKEIVPEPVAPKTPTHVGSTLEVKLKK